MKTTRAVLKLLVDALADYGEEMMFNGDDPESPSFVRASSRLERAHDEANRHLDMTAPKRREVLGKDTFHRTEET